MKTPTMLLVTLGLTVCGCRLGRAPPAYSEVPGASTQREESIPAPYLGEGALLHITGATPGANREGVVQVLRTNSVGITDRLSKEQMEKCAGIILSGDEVWLQVSPERAQTLTEALRAYGVIVTKSHEEVGPSSGPNRR